MRQFGIIGKPLGHSFSEQYFTDMFLRAGIDAIYTPYEIDSIDSADEWIQQIEGFNVTYPYKQAIIPYLQEIDPIAQRIGAVNVVYHGKGYNTDWIGFRDSLRPLLKPHHKRALLLGTGGVSKAIQYALEQLGIGYTLVSRKTTDKAISYEDLDEGVIKAHSIIVNCTPLGMHPFENEKPNIPYHLLSVQHILFDCIYNPEKTLFLQAGEGKGCTIKNGLEMLHLQANEASKIFEL